MNRSWLLASAAMLLPSLATAATFTGVAAGDMSATDAILWTRTTDATGAAIADTVTAQVATDPGFTNIVQSYTGATTVATSGTVKLDATGLGSGARYYYRFQDATATSGTGSFTTAPAADARAAVKLGFSGDADGQWRPYPSISAIAKQNLNYFVFLGDTIYETASGTAGTAAFSPAVPDASLATTPAALAAVKSAYDAKYLQNIIPVPGSVAGAQATLEPLFTATGTYTLLDNHELGNKGLQNGGAPLASATNANAGVPTAGFDVNTTGAYINQTAGYKTVLQSYEDFHPTKTPTVVAPGDTRSDGTLKQYFAQQWGKNSIFVNVDDRSYRDVRLKTTGGAADDTGPRADNPARTLLGSTQLAWLKQTLLDAQAAGTPWKIVATSSPIDLQGNDGGKSWAGGYRAERNDLLKFIADNHIDHVVFLSTDDHETRISQLAYETTPGDATTYVQVPGAFEIVTGPIGAGNACSGAVPPADCAGTTLANIQNLLATSGKTTVPGLLAGTPIDGGLNGAPPIGGTFSGIAGLTNIYRALDPTAGTSPQPLDFYSPNTFAYSTLDISADGSKLTVNVLGIPEYGPNVFPASTSPTDPTIVLSFDIVAVPEPATAALLIPALFGLIRRRR